MREIRLSGSEGGGTGNSTGPPYPYRALPGRERAMPAIHTPPKKQGRQSNPLPQHPYSLNPYSLKA